MTDGPAGAFPIGIAVEVQGEDIVIQFSTVISNYGIQLPIPVMDQFVQLCIDKLTEAKGAKIKKLYAPKNNDIILPNGVNVRKDN